MKKFVNIIFAILVLIIIGECGLQYYTNKKVDKEIESISSKIIRFHVLANSDKESDQKLKLKVKDEVIKFISPKLKDSKSIDESRNILKKYDKEIKDIAGSVIKKNGYNYAVSTSLAKENFPVKVYGNITLPQGKYEAYRILIGDAEGQNWWCVMFPPLCFVDVTKGQIAYNETENRMKKVLTNEEYNLVDNTVSNKEVKFKFKIVEVLKNSGIIK